MTLLHDLLQAVVIIRPHKIKLCCYLYFVDATIDPHYHMQNRIQLVILSMRGCKRMHGKYCGTNTILDATK